MKRFIFLFLSLVVLGSPVWSQVTLFDGSRPITYHIEGPVSPVVRTALDMWKGDMQQVTGLLPVAAVDGTIRIVEKDGGDDGFRIRTEQNRVVIEGFSPRGTAYGLLELSRQAGVSPWVWWGDVVPERRHRLVMPVHYRQEQHPSVAYRGIFLNDEDWSLRPWSSTTHAPGPRGCISAATYRRIFQLLLRLRANAVWPAMHEGTVAFFQTPGAKAVADSCGIVVGTSHCEPLLRNNVGEWDVAQRGRFNYRTNRQAVQQYWTERLDEVRGSRDNMFTIGMRGIHDSSMEGYHTDAEKLQGLQQVVDDQQELLRQHIGDPARLMQVFVPYKEVLQLYEHGLQVPDYVTLMWCDDNYGYMTRYSTATEQQRTGGAGLYYHLSYWGRPHDYLWLCTTQPGLIYHELRQAYDHQVRRLWIANVHDPKVAGYQLELFLDMAWNIHSVTAATVERHYRQWLCRQFGQEAGLQLFPAMRQYYRLCCERRPEFMGWTQVELDKKRYARGLSSVDTIGMTPRQAASRLKAFEGIANTIGEVGRMIRPELSDAYFAAIAYPVCATAAMNRKLLTDSATSHQAYQEILDLTEQYNQLRGGKWHGLMDYAPRRLPVFGNVHGILAPVSDADSDDEASWHDAYRYSQHTGQPQAIQLLGRSLQAVSLPRDATLTYDIEVQHDGHYLLTTAAIPTHPIDSGDLRYSVSMDGNTPVVYSLKEPFRSERWKQNVLSQQTLRTTPLHLSKGHHTLVLRALDEHIVIDRWRLSPQR